MVTVGWFGSDRCEIDIVGCKRYSPEVPIAGLLQSPLAGDIQTRFAGATRTSNSSKPLPIETAFGTLDTPVISSPEVGEIEQ